MLIPLNRKKFEDIIPLVATSEQYKYCWGKLPDVLRRLLYSLAGVIVVLTLRYLLGEGFDLFMSILAIVVGLYWLWSPVYWASRRNAEYRKFTYSGFWQGEVVDKFITEELIGQEETVNKRGELVIIENRERRLNLEVEDESGFKTTLQVPLQRSHRSIRPGDIAEMVVVSNRPDLSRIAKISDIYLPDNDLWVSDYPVLRRDAFIDTSRQLNRSGVAYGS
ncbi:MAG: phosphate ABC transporter permease [Elainellaceae cyanobacterium]